MPSNWCMSFVALQAPAFGQGNMYVVVVYIYTCVCMHTQNTGCLRTRDKSNLANGSSRSWLQEDILVKGAWSRPYDL